MFSEFSSTFRIERIPLYAFALKLNKVIRLCQATGLTPVQLESLVYSFNTGGIIDSDVLARLFTSLFYQSRYAMALDDALVLSGADISQRNVDGEQSHFDQIFNTPPLGGHRLLAGNEPVVISPAEGSVGNSAAALMRGLAVNSGDMLTLCRLMDASTVDSVRISIEHISHLWRLRLLARVHRLSVQELALLYHLSPCSGINAASLTLPQWRSLTEFLYQSAHLMSEISLSAGELYLLCTHDAGTSLTPEMNNMLQSLHPRLSGVNIENESSDALAAMLAPFVSATLNLSSPDMGRHLLLLTEKLRSDVLRMAAFSRLAAKEALNPGEIIQITRFCHALAQTALMVQKLVLSEAEVAFMARQDTPLPGGVTPAERVRRLLSLHVFHQWLNSLNSRGSAMLAALEQRTLTAEKLASEMGIEQLMIEQAMSCAGVTDLGRCV